MAREAKQAGVGSRRKSSVMAATPWLSIVTMALVGVLGAGCDAEPEASTEAPAQAVGEGASRLDLRQGSAEQGSKEEPGGGGIKVPVDQVADDGRGDIDPLIEPDPIPWHLPAPGAHANDA